MEKTKNDYSVKSPVEKTNEESKKFELTTSPPRSQK